jgi:hypothetical protein
VCPGEALPWDRITATGYSASQFWENIAAGNHDAVNTFEQWRTSSSGHNEAMLACDAQAAGISRLLVNDFQDWPSEVALWTLNMGDVEDHSTLITPTPSPTLSPTPTITPPIPGGRTCFEFDPNQNNTIDDSEILELIVLWITSSPICEEA